MLLDIELAFNIFKKGYVIFAKSYNFSTKYNYTFCVRLYKLKKKIVFTNF